MTDDDHEFLVPAFNRIGRHLHGDAWRDDFPALDTLEVKAARAEDASPEERAWAHRLLLALFPETYREDYEEPPPPRLNTFAALGTGRLPPLGGALNALGSSDYSELPQRAPGWWFSEADWSRFRSAIHYKNELQKPKLRMVDAAANWLFNRVVRGEITPFVQHRMSGGQWAATTTNDWRMPSAQRLRARIRTCSMMPGHPAAGGGLFWIFINKQQMADALARDAIAPDASDRLKQFSQLYDEHNAMRDRGGTAWAGKSENDLGGNTEGKVEQIELTGEESTPDQSQFDTQAYWRTHAPAIKSTAAAYLAEHGDLTRRDAFVRAVLEQWPKLTPNMVLKKVWKTAIHDAQLSHLSRPGNRKGNTRKK
jgi:hypothetical protein